MKRRLYCSVILFTLAVHGRGKIGRIGVGVGVVAGTAKPDIRTADAIKQELLNAKSMTWGEEGASRPAIDRMIKELGVADRLKPKVRLTKNVDQSMELVRTGQADLVITLISEILPAKGVEFAGPLPPKFQDYVTFAAGISAASKNMDAAQAAVEFITGSTVAPAFKAKGRILWESGERLFSPIGSFVFRNRSRGRPLRVCAARKSPRRAIVVKRRECEQAIPVCQTAW